MDWESIRFQFVISVDMPPVVWTWVHVSPPLQSMPASHFTTVGIHFLQQSLNQMPGNCIALSSQSVQHASVTRQTTRPIYLLLYSLPNFSFVEFCILSPKALCARLYLSITMEYDTLKTLARCESPHLRILRNDKLTRISRVDRKVAVSTT